MEAGNEHVCHSVTFLAISGNSVVLGIHNLQHDGSDNDSHTYNLLRWRYHSVAVEEFISSVESGINIAAGYAHNMQCGL